jgi:hypothetical protein
MAAVFDVRVGQVSPRVVRAALNPYVGKEALCMQYITVFHDFKGSQSSLCLSSLILVICDAFFYR